MARLSFALPIFERCERPSTASVSAERLQPGRLAQGPDEKCGTVGRTVGFAVVIVDSGQTPLTTRARVGRGAARTDLGKCLLRVNRTADVLASCACKSGCQGHGACAREALFFGPCQHKASTESATAGAINTASASNTTARSSSKYPRISTGERVGSRLSMNCPGTARASTRRTLRPTRVLVRINMAGINKKTTVDRRRSTDSARLAAGMRHPRSALRRPASVVRIGDQNLTPMPVRTLLMLACIDCMSTNSHSPRTKTFGITQISTPTPAAYPKKNAPFFVSLWVTGPKNWVGSGVSGGLGGVCGSGISVLVYETVAVRKTSARTTATPRNA